MRETLFDQLLGSIAEHFGGPPTIRDLTDEELEERIALLEAEIGDLREAEVDPETAELNRQISVLTERLATPILDRRYGRRIPPEQDVAGREASDSSLGEQASRTLDGRRGQVRPAYDPDDETTYNTLLWR